MTYRRGDVVLVPFPFTDLSNVKRRPALVISNDEYNNGTGDVIIAQITSRINSPPRPGDYLISAWRETGLIVPSLLRVRMTTLHSSLLIRALGRLPPADLDAFGRRAAEVLGFATASAPP